MLKRSIFGLTLLLWLSMALAGADAAPASRSISPFDLRAALSRVPLGEWERIAYADISGTMQQRGFVWPPQEALPTEESLWEGLWQPALFTENLADLGFSVYQVEQVVEARRGADFALWLEGDFEVLAISEALLEAAFQALDEFPAEAYRSQTLSWNGRLPFIALPDGETLLIASSQATLRALLDVYDGLSQPILQQDRLLRALVDNSPTMTSAVILFGDVAEGCPLEVGRWLLHGLRYDAPSSVWQALLYVGYAEVAINNLAGLTDGLEFSTYHPSGYDGVLGQHSKLILRTLQDSPAGSILQFTLALRDDPALRNLPFALASEANACALFETAPAATLGLGLPFLPDLAAGRSSLTIRFGNVEQALYNADLNTRIISPLSDLSPAQQIALNGTWRGTLAFENNFGEWFGFSPQLIHQTAEITLTNGDYARVLWGAFSQSDVEAALTKTGYIALEQYQGTRIFDLRNAPQSGGILLGSQSQSAASPHDGLLVFANSLNTMRLALDVYKQNARSGLLRYPELVLVSRLTEDATNVSLRRYRDPVSGGLVCGLPPYQVEAFANVLRPDGWYFLYSVGFAGQIPELEQIGERLARALSESDYPMRGPGSAAFSVETDLSATRVSVEANASAIVIELRVLSPEQQASFFGQDLSQVALTPCALGDISG